jgi:hypothetical protein
MPAAPRTIDFESYVAEHRPAWVRKLRQSYDTLVALGSITPPTDACVTHDYQWDYKAGVCRCRACGEER